MKIFFFSFNDLDKKERKRKIEQMTFFSLVFNSFFYIESHWTYIINEESRLTMCHLLLSPNGNEMDTI